MVRSPSGLPAAAAWRGTRVLVTGHTGFKGAWLSLWLAELGATVHGLALEPPTSPSLFDDARVADVLASDTRGDICDRDVVARAFDRARPQVVLHLAAQSLVRKSHAEPVETFATNVLGTAHVLDESLRSAAECVVVVTSDKCYENREWVHPYRENDALGGRDPYSASKGCAEIVTASFRGLAESKASAPRIASARAGNVLGAWDWAADRLVPDCVRAFSDGAPAAIRNPGSVRPWQHVLEPLGGYLLLAERLRGPDGLRFARGWNFGPDASGDATVLEIARDAAELWGGQASIAHVPDPGAGHESAVLRLDSTAARIELGWAPRWSLREMLAATIGGYRRGLGSAPLRDIVLEQVRRHHEESGAA